MKERVRAIITTPAGTMLTIKRVRPGIGPYWVLPGGVVEATDASLEAALAREVREEIAGEIDVLSLLYIQKAEAERQYFYLAAIKQWSFDERTGPEFSEDGRGDYQLKQVSLDAVGIDSIDLKPAGIADFLRTVLQTGGGLRAQPDLRHSETSP